MRRSPLRPVGAVLIALLCAAGCTSPTAPQGRDQVAGPQAPVAAPSDGERPPPGELSVETFDEQSRVEVADNGVRPSTVTVTGNDVGRSEVEVRIQQILSELEATTTPEGSLVTLPEQVLFDFDSAQLKPEASATLDRLAEALVLAGDRRVSVRGHTDSRGADDYNQDLSARRAGAVRDYFVRRHGVDPARLEAVGFGETQPVAPNEAPDGADDPTGRERNRRVEILLAP